METGMVSALVRFALLVFPFRWIAPLLGKQTQEASQCRSPQPDHERERIAWAVDVAGRYLPWNSTCLSQAITAKMLLRRRGIPSTLYLGAGRDEQDKICYHAWLRSGDSVVAGGPIEKTYTILATFSEHGK